MNPGTSQQRNSHLSHSLYQTAPMRLTLEGQTPGEWLLREFAKANECANRFEILTKKRPWWRLW